MECKKATLEHVSGIVDVCTKAYRATYQHTHSTDYIERIIQQFYSMERVTEDVLVSTREWSGYYVAVQNEKVVGVIGGGFNKQNKAEIYVLYLDPSRKGEGIGTQLLQMLTAIQQEMNATEQWVSVSKGNTSGISFYEARGFSFVKEEASFENADKEHYRSLRYFRTI